MPELTHADLKVIEEKLKGIEDKMGSKWTVPILVAVVSGIIAMTNVVIQEKFAHQRAIADQERALALKDEEAKIADGEKSYSQMFELTWDIRRNFRSQCRRADVDEEKLYQALDNLRDVAEAIRVKYEEEELANSIQSYGNWVGETVSNPNRTGCELADNEQYASVAKALKDFKDKRCTRQRKHGQPTGFLAGFF